MPEEKSTRMGVSCILTSDTLSEEDNPARWQSSREAVGVTNVMASEQRSSWDQTDYISPQNL